jgi:hypothetical protein
MDPANVRGDYVDHGSALLRRADELLKSVAHQNGPSRPPPTH